MIVKCVNYGRILVGIMKSRHQSGPACKRKSRNISIIHWADSQDFSVILLNIISRLSGSQMV